MAKAKKLPSGNYRVNACVVIDGVKTYKSFTAPTARKAEIMALEWQENARTSSNIAYGMTLSQAVDKYISDKKNAVSPSTTATYEKYKRNYFKALMDIRIDKIDKVLFNAEINNMLEHNAPKTVRSAASFYNSAIAYFTNTRLNITLPKKQKIIYRTPSADVLKLIFNAVRGTDIEIAVLLAAWLGMRQSEVRGLKWDKVYDDYIVIDTALVTISGKSVEKGTKTSGSTRKVMLPKYIKNLIEKAPRTSDYVVPLSASTIGKHFKKLLRDNNIPDCRYHDLRHANASIMLMLGVPDKYAMERGGWDTPDTLQNIYQQTFGNEQIKISSQIDSYFEDNILN